jgi:uncharacterized membrane protein
MRRLLAALLLLATPAAAQDALPILADVTGVAADDVLNVRGAPDASAEIVGTLAPDMRGVEVVGLDPSGGWGQVNTGESSGWAAMRFLASREGIWRAGALPEGLTCFGTEPFWSLRPGGGRLVLATPEGPERDMALSAALDIGIDGDPQRALVAEDADGRLTVGITPAACSDGMSDRGFGLAALVVREGGGAAELLTGCCSLGR